MASSTNAALDSITEERLIELIRKWLGPPRPQPPYGIGDDCAVLPRSRTRLLVTVDPVIRGLHFDNSVAPSAVAAKLLKRTISDVAAMGGAPRHAVVALAAPPTLLIAWLREFYRALGRMARRYDILIVGGDCSKTSGFLGAFLTLMGDAPPRPLTRLGARPGDLLFVTGALGGSRLGRHYRFTPRIEEGQWLAKKREVHAAIDLSDGLGKDLWALVPSGVHVVIDPRAVPLSTAARKLSRRTRNHPLTHAFNDGDDYELLFAVSSRHAKQLARSWRARFSTRLSCIGKIEHSALRGATVVFEPAPPVEVPLRGYEHFD